jgi:hypothetical protein
MHYIASGARSWSACQPTEKTPWQASWCNLGLLVKLKKSPARSNSGNVGEPGMRSLTQNTGGGRGGVLELWDGTRKTDKLLVILSQICIKPTTSWLVRILEHLGARISHRRPWTHKTHHGPDSGEATTFPHIVFFAPLHGTYIQMAFIPGLPRSPETIPAWTPAISQNHNFLLRPPIGMRS